LPRSQHGKRADAIVKNMLLHSREGSGEHRSREGSGEHRSREGSGEHRDRLSGNFG
jgi:hypothetical protein